MRGTHFLYRSTIFSYSFCSFGDILRTSSRKPGIRTRPSASVKPAMTRIRSLSGSDVAPPSMPLWIGFEMADSTCEMQARRSVRALRRDRTRRTRLDACVDDAAQAERQARDVLAQPVRVADEDHVDVADQVL